jgi:hypothetical protein
MGAAASVLTKVGLADSVNPLLGLKTREEKLAKVFVRMDKNQDGHLDMGELACIAEKLDKAGVEEVRREFIRLDQDEDGVVTQAEFVDYYLDQLEGYEEREFEFWCMAYIHLKHYSTAELFRAGIVDESGEDMYRKNKRLKKEEDERRAKKLAEEMHVDPVMLRKAKNRKMEKQRIQMIVNGSGSLCVYDDDESHGGRKKLKKLKAAAKMIGHMASHLADEKAHAEKRKGF